MSSTPTKLTFLSLPRELRDEIYDQFIVASALPCSPNGKSRYDINAFRGIKAIGAAVPDCIDEIIQRVYAARGGLEFHFESLSQTRAFLADKIWCPRSAIQMMRGDVSALLDDDESWTKMIQLALFCNQAGRLYFRGGRWWGPGGKGSECDVLVPVNVINVVGVADMLENPCEDVLGLRFKVIGIDWEVKLNVRLLEPRVRIEGSIGMLGLLHDKP
ncbi:uncharacterized protein PV09_06448 [Verruconis gallopava]|uniref:Uncharacterized protein n=1 Tax=Verruconis gallopava TaxID=253628 RepID=A0A0D1XJ25_9PEZI|nr:uncharacterized protein PV09_06448 [Verruconis gallopava]KIW02301.1 hypothetical protein PV09_06448 [Verruconis gallopava]